MDHTSVNFPEQAMDLPEKAMDIDDVFMAHPSDRPTQIADLLKWSYALHL